MKKIVILMSLMLTMGACTTLQTHTPELVQSVSEINEKEYQLSNIFVDKNMTVGFDSQNRIFGFSGVNRYFGKAKIDGGKLEVENLASTRMGGPKEYLIREEQYLSLLKTMTKIEKIDNKIILSNEGKDKLIFIEK